MLGYLQNTLVCHDLATGELIWRHVLSSGYDEHAAWPIYSEPYLWISSPFQAGSELLEITRELDRPVRTVWKSDRMSNDIFSSVLLDGAIYGFDLDEAQAKTHRASRGTFLCQDFLTGEKLWSVGDPRYRYSPGTSSDGKEPRVGHATVIVADGKLILLNDTGELILARANRERYEELARVTILGGEICWTQPTLFRGRLFVRNHSRVACIYLGDPSHLKRATLDRATAWRSAGAGALLVLGCLAYFLLCRRLSLVFEWVFLCGFAPALPFLIAGSLWYRERRWRAMWEASMTTLAFTSFYWGAATILLLKP